MLKIIVLITGIMQMLGPAAGVNSLQPVATYQTIVTDQRLTGEWTDGQHPVRIELLPDSKILKEEGSDEKKLPLGETKEEIAFYSKTYVITIKQQGIDYILLGSFSRINDQLFMDIRSLGIKSDKEPGKDSGFEFAPDYLSVFNIARVGFTGKDKIDFTFLNGNFIKEQISKGNMRLKHEQDDLFGSFILTASSFEWRQFLEKYGHDERLFYQKGTTILTRKG